MSTGRIGTLDDLVRDVDVLYSDCDEKTILNPKRTDTFNTIKIDFVNVLRDVKFDTKLLERLQEIGKPTSESIRLKKAIENNLNQAQRLYCKLVSIESKNRQVSNILSKLISLNALIPQYGLLNSTLTSY